MNSDSATIRIAMLGMIEGNGHPYSWSAIINGYDPEKMAKCPYSGIIDYLSAQPIESVRIPSAKVTHIWTDRPEDAAKVAAASKIDHVAARPEEVLGQVDAIIVATDDGNDHVGRARPFLAAGLPVFIDKPLAINIPDLNQFSRWQRAGYRFLSTSGMRYAPEIEPVTAQREQLGELRWITSFTCKSWERYGIHALEAIYPLLGPGFSAVRTEHQTGSDLVYLTHATGVQVTLAAIHDAVGSFGALHLYGTKGHLPIHLRDTYNAFRRQLLAFIDMVRTKKSPVDFRQTVELMAILIAGIRSRERAGRSVPLAEIFAELDQYDRATP